MVDRIRINADLLNALPDGILIVDQKGRIIFFSQQLEKLSGYGAEDLEGKSVELLMPERYRRGHVHYRTGYFAADTPIRSMGTGLKIYLQSADQREIPVDIALAPLKTETGTMVLAAVRDATERTRVEQELRESRERFQLLINGVEDYAIFMLDPGGHVMSWNSGAERIKGYPAEEILGQHFSIFYLPEDVAAGKPQLALGEAAETGRYEEEGWRARKNGERFWADAVITALRDETGKLRGFSKVTRDITEPKRAQDRVAAVVEIGQAILSGQNSQDLLALVCKRARDLMDAATAMIAMPGPGGGPARVAVVDGDGADQLRGLELGSDGLKAAAEAIGLGPVVTVPLLAGGRSLGTLSVANRHDSRPFSPAGRLVIELFAAQAAVAIEYDRARDELRRLDVMEERERIGRDLHDGVIQSLFAVGMNLQATALRANSAEIEERIDLSVGEIDGAIRDLRNYIFGLRPGIVADRHLAQAIQQLASDVERESGVVIAIDVDERLAGRLASGAGDIIQLVRESLSNMARHAAAATSRVSLREVNGRAVLKIEDDGRGFEVGARGRPGQGLRNLRERTEALGGDLQIKSRPGEGTTVRIRLPL